MHHFLETKMQSCYPVTVISEIVTGSTMTFSKREHGIGADNIVMGEMYFVGLPFCAKNIYSSSASTLLLKCKSVDVAFSDSSTLEKSL